MKHKKQSEKTIIPVSIIIPTFNEEKNIAILLKSIFAQDVAPREIIVADNNSIDNTREVAGAFGVKVVKGGDVATGRNNGVKSSKENIIFAFDADAQLKGTSDLRKLYNFFIQNKLDVANALVQLECKKCRVGVYVANAVIRGLLWLSRVLQRPILGSGNLTMFTRNAFNRIGGFDVNFSGSAEDLLFTQTATRMGLKYSVAPIVLGTSARRFNKNLLKVLLILFGAFLAGILVTFRVRNNSFLRLAKELYGKMGGSTA